MCILVINFIFIFFYKFHNSKLNTCLEIEGQGENEGLPSTSPRRFKISPHNACNQKNIITPLNIRGFSTSIQMNCNVLGFLIYTFNYVNKLKNRNRKPLI